MPPALLRALIRGESGGRQRDESGQILTSSAGAQGLTQLMPGTAAGLGVDPTKAGQNIRGGARYLRQQLDTFNGDWRLALAAYNAGPGAVEQHGGIPPYQETQDYVKRVLGYAKEFPGGGPLGAQAAVDGALTSSGGSGQVGQELEAVQRAQQALGMIASLGENQLPAAPQLPQIGEKEIGEDGEPRRFAALLPGQGIADVVAQPDDSVRRRAKLMETIMAAKAQKLGTGVTERPFTAGTIGGEPLKVSSGKGNAQGIVEAFYDPIGQWDNGEFKTTPIGNHSDHVHLSFATPKAALRYIKIAQEMGLHVGENEWVDPVDPVHVNGSFHYQAWEVDGRTLNKAIDVSGEPDAMAQFFRRAVGKKIKE